MRARFVGDPNDGGGGPDEITVWGVPFVKGEWRAVTDGRFARHSHFETEGAASVDPFDHDGDGRPGGSLPKARRGRPPKATEEGA